MKPEKTNVMRIFDQKKIPYQQYDYSGKGVLSGEEVVQALGQNPEQVFKTLVTVSGTGKHYVFVIPVPAKLDLKKAAKAVQEKSIAMLKEKELFPLTGYVHGGCSPVGMKKFFPTVIDSSAQHQETIIFSAGKIGYQVEVSLENLNKVISFRLADLIIS